MKTIIIISICFITSFAQINYDEYFEDKSLRIDYYHTGNAEEEFYSIDELIEEPFWGGSKTNLIDPFNLGDYLIKVYDDSSGKLIYSYTYSTLFGEWQTVAEAKKTYKSFSETVVIPYPKNKIKIEFYSCDKKNNPVLKFEYFIDPENYFIKQERRFEYPVFDVMVNGDASKKVDIVFIPDGYTDGEMNLFKEDCKKFAAYLFNASPFKENKDKFNIRGIEAPSLDSGPDIPALDIWNRTLVNTTYYTFDLERYLMTADNKKLRDVAANVPYDQIYVIVNSDKYGGGAIYNHYSVAVNESVHEEFVFTHEFGHGFAGLADEYYTSDVAYENFYPLDVEPLEPNITTLVNFESKWIDMVDEETPVPTPVTNEYQNVIGAFEGGGYVAEGVYRPMIDCTMKSTTVNNFCPVCKKAIQDMIDFYSK